MTTIIFVEANGTRHAVNGVDGQSLMDIAVAARVPGIVGDCGGCCACATCHVELEGNWRQRLAPPDATETAMLEAAVSLTDNSRLCCQIKVCADLEGLIAHIPELPS